MLWGSCCRGATSTAHGTRTRSEARSPGWRRGASPSVRRRSCPLYRPPAAPTTVSPSAVPCGKKYLERTHFHAGGGPVSATQGKTQIETESLSKSLYHGSHELPPRMDGRAGGVGISVPTPDNDRQVLPASPTTRPSFPSPAAPLPARPTPVGAQKVVRRRAQRPPPVTPPQHQQHPKSGGQETRLPTTELVQQSAFSQPGRRSFHRPPTSGTPGRNSASAHTPDRPTASVPFTPLRGPRPGFRSGKVRHPSPSHCLLGNDSRSDSWPIVSRRRLRTAVQSTNGIL